MEKVFKVNIVGKEHVEYDLYLKAQTEDEAKAIIKKDFFETEFFEVTSMTLEDITEIFNATNEKKVLN